VATTERDKPDNVKQQVIAQRGFKNLRLRCEHVAEIDYQPASPLSHLQMRVRPG
jgi:hypothetical protein